MKEMVLKRLYSDEGLGTFGLLMTTPSGGSGLLPFAVTLEQPWRGNKPDNPNTPENDSSCIPAGRYVCKRVMSPKFGLTYEITGVPNRTAILFHGGDKTDQSLGCILVGLSFGGTVDNMLDGCVEALKKLLAIGGREFRLTIEDCQ